ncbi:MAG: 5-formyltetrahydrofolate cyclo-ligase [Deltaproteobacteria bacterium]|nr:5-formyltetrahydrofolate cyclo-ligase [Deltaproteobacteria bacterium]
MDHSIDVTKKTYREVLLRQRALISRNVSDHVSRMICRHLATWLVEQRVTTVFLYMPVRGEIDPLPVTTMLPNLEYALPVTSSDGMHFYRWSAGDPLRIGAYGIPEPIPDSPALVPTAATAILVPSLAVSHNGVRLGYGGGYFDRYLMRSDAKVIAVTTDNFLLPELPVEPHDQLMGWVVTESGVLKLTESKRPYHLIESD